MLHRQRANPRGPDLLLDGLVALLSDTYGAAVPILRQAKRAIEGETSQTRAAALDVGGDRLNTPPMG